MNTAHLICPSCRGTDFASTWEKQAFEYGVAPHTVELSAQVPVQTCQSCGTGVLDDQAEDLRHDAVCRHLGRLTPSEIRELRGGLTRAEFAARTGIGVASLARWETGQLIQGAALDSFLYLLQFEPNLERLNDRPTEPQEMTSLNEEFSFSDVQSQFTHITQTDRDLVERQRRFRLVLN